MAEDPQPMSIQARIAALNHAHVGRMPSDTDPSQPRMKPIVPSKPSLAHRQKSVNIPLADVNGTVTKNTIGNEPSGARQNGFLPPPVITRTGQKTVDKPKPAPPPLPKRQPTSPSPALPPRRPSETSTRRDSFESTNSAISSISALSNGTTKTTPNSRSASIDANARLRAPAWGDGAPLPPLPPKRENKDKGRAPLKPTKSTPNILLLHNLPAISPSLPPQLPPRRPSDDNQSASQPPQKLPVTRPATVPKVPILSLSLNKTPEEQAPIPKERLNRDVHPQSNGIHRQEASYLPPPIPVSSKPALLSTSPIEQSSNICFKCRDFSGPDTHAAQYPRQSLPTQDLSWLAQQLTQPFPSHTDKARALFTWLHHNIDYDVQAFFNNRVQASTPNSTLATGLAVCEGYAALFTTLATHAGLQSVVVSGHGKGFGHQALPPGASLPPFDANHAWNAVQIDGGEWKLIDTCWGAGDVNGFGQPYNKNFKPQYFTMSNNEFGLKHYPTNKSQFYRDDGRSSIPWDEYILTDPNRPNGVENLTVFSDVQKTHGLGDTTFLPCGKQISVRQSGTLHFQFGLLCPHWTTERTGKGAPYVFILIIHGVDGRKDDYIPFEYIRGRNPGTSGGGDSWALDIEARSLGAPGQKLMLFAVTSFDGRDGRGVSTGQFREKVGRCGMGFAGVAEWVLV